MVSDNVAQKALKVFCGRSLEKFGEEARESLICSKQSLMGNSVRTWEDQNADRNIDRPTIWAMAAFS
jgi:hypothetical protein